jgi:predicted  nucleic acid-binding Zn-ribbon protein
MTAKRLEELKKKFNSATGNIQDIGELLAEFFQSFSAHVKEIKGQIKEVQANQELLFNEIEELKIAMNPIYTIIHTDED